MRKTIILFFILSSFLLANVGKVVAFKGKAEIIRDGKAIDVNKNTIFYKKDILTTKKNTKLQILFNDETIITVGQNSVFKINNYIFDNLNSKAEFSMTKGVFRTITGKIGKIVPKNFKLKTKTASIGIRGTQIVTQIDENIEKIFCTEGKIEITNIITNASVEVFKGEFIEILKERTNEPLEVRKIKKNDIKNINQNLTIEKNLANDSISVIKKDPVANNKITIKETQELNKDKLVIDNKPINSEESQRNTEVITSQETDVNTLEDENTNIVSNSQNNSVTDDSNNSEDTAYTSDTVEDVVADVSDTTENELENNADTVEEVVENTTDTITENNSEDTPAITDNTTDTVEDVVADASDTTENIVENVADTITEDNSVTNNTTDTVEDVVADVSDTTNDDSILGGILDIFTDDDNDDSSDSSDNNTNEEDILLSDVINSIDNITSSSYLYNTTANASYNGNFNNHEFNTGSQYLKDINKNKVDIPEDTTISMDIDFGANFNQLTNGKININDVGDGTSRELNFEGSADKFFSTISFSPSNTTKGAGGSGTFYGDEAELIKGSLNMKSSDNIQIKGNFDAVKK